MFIAHIPATYILAKVVTRRKLTRWESAAVAAGAVFPDLDLLRFYFLDNCQIHHHDYWTHIPFVWLCIVGSVYGAARVTGNCVPVAVSLFFLGGFLHLGLDSFAGEIKWLWPFSGAAWPLISVPVVHKVWYMSFVMHWLFKAELLICAVAVVVAWRSR